ncbi:MAG: DUF2207 domain-containing protein [Sphaerochaetaceae bacterium]|nr:DUF2207 domain-containing protein [Sphaerochaetaceae bacterium]
MNVYQYLSRNRAGFTAGILLLCLLFPLSAADYTIDSFNSSIIITSEGHYDIEESATLTFNVPKHGFYRTVPVSFTLDDGSSIKARVTKIRASEDLEVSRNSYSVVMRLGSPDYTVTGTHDYAISYRYDIGEDRFTDKDEFYFNIIGTDWDVPLEESSFTIEFPFPIDTDAISFTSGEAGSTSGEQVSWSIDDSGKTITGTAGRIAPDEAVTVKVDLPEGYFESRTNWQAIIAPFALVLTLLGLFLAFRWWRTYGRDKNLVIVPVFTAPEDLSPLDAGYIIDSSLDIHDVTSMLFYWADKGAVTIVEEDKKISFIKGKPLSDPLPHEQQLFDRFFALGKNGVVTEKDLKNDFIKVYAKVQQTVAKHYTKERRLDSREAKVKAGLTFLLGLIPVLTLPLVLTVNYPGAITLVIAGISLAYLITDTVIIQAAMSRWHIRKTFSKVMFFFLLFLIFVIVSFVVFAIAYFETSQQSLALWAVPAAFISLFIFALFTVITTKRSDYGVKKLEEVMGLREFIEKVEIDELKRMIEKDPEYYYHLLSYAIVLGLEKKWAKKFDSFTLEPPRWYSGDQVLFNSLAISAIVNRCDRSLASNLAPKGSSSPGHVSSGFSGGSSGGGFGGGGGGAW